MLQAFKIDLMRLHQQVDGALDGESFLLPRKTHVNPLQVNGYDPITTTVILYQMKIV
ncbi:hypothetical protein FSOLCH5_003158 [Fusarium solani]